MLQDNLARAGKNATYTSKTIQNELIEVTGTGICQGILDKVTNPFFYTVLADEVADVSDIEQWDLVLWFVSHTGAIKEHFIKFLSCTDGAYGEALSALYISSRQEHGLDVNLLSGQGYDRAGALTVPSMAWLLESRSICPLALYVHCFFDRGNRGSAVWSHKGHFYFAPIAPYMGLDGTVSVAKFVGPGGISSYYGGRLLHLDAETTQGVA